MSLARLVLLEQEPNLNSSVPLNDAQPLTDLKSHSAPYVTVGALADYWLVSRKQIHKQIEAGALPAVHFSPRVIRIRTSDALRFERLAALRPNR